MTSLLLLLACGPKPPPADPAPAAEPSAEASTTTESSGLGLAGEGDMTGLSEDRSGPPREGLPPLAPDPPAVEGALPPEALKRLSQVGARMAWCAGGALGRDPHLRGAAQVTARYDAEGKAEEVQVQGEGDEVLHGCLGAQAKRLLLREGAATVTWTVPLDPRHVSPGAVLRGNGYSVGYTDPAPELPALLLALGFPEPIDGAPEHAALAEALAASPHGCGELLPPMAPRPIGVLELLLSGGEVASARVLSSDAKGEDLLACVEAHYGSLSLPGNAGRYSYVVSY